MRMRDKSGHELGRNDLIVYALNHTHGVAMQFGKVLRAGPDYVSVQGVDKGKLIRRSTLKHPERILRIEAHQVPDDVLALLRQAALRSPLS